MPIILAIEPDRRQRDALSAVVRQRVGAELILADTTERALEAIGNRVPDLVLVPALLSPTDDAALAAALRVIAAAAHVRTLTIPVLAAHTEAAPSSGLLSRWRRGRAPSPALEGCDPAVFAEQISAYLKEGAAERALRIEAEEHELQRQGPAFAPEQEPQYAQEFGSDDLQSAKSGAASFQDPVAAGQDAGTSWDGLPTYTPLDVPAFAQPAYEQPETQTYAPPDMQPYAQSDVPAYAQSEVHAYAQSDVQTHAQPEAPAYAPPATQAYARNDAPTYAELDAHTYAQPDMPDAQPEAPAYLFDPVAAELEPDLVDADLQHDSVEAAISYIEPEAPEIHADALSEELDLAEGDEYDNAPAHAGEARSAREFEQEEDIDLSDELAELESEETGGMRVEAGEMELFDGEPVGVYTMPAIDEPEADASVLDAQGAFEEAEAEIAPEFVAETEPVLLAGAIAETEAEADTAVDPEFFIDSFGDGAFDAAPSEPADDGEAAVDREFFADSFAEPPFEAEPATEPEPEAASAVASAFDADADADATADSPAVDDIDPEDAEPEPADAEPWASAFLSSRWVWPAMEGVPTEQPSAFASVDAVAVTAVPVAAAPPPAAPEARPAPAPHKRPEWSELVASLRKDIERRRVEPPQEKPKAAASVQAVPRRSKKAKPIQDEWGFFDPEQCGFAALLAKLDEITESAEDTAVQQSSVHQSS